MTPEAAVALCYEGPPTALGPQPGQARAGTSLPPVHADALTGLVEEKAAALDKAAAREKGLELVVAAALGDFDTALSVQLPERYIVQSPKGNSQALLLWGLRRTVWPILGNDGRRGWSFSTFEPPLSAMDPGTLPDIVFRLAQAAQQGAPQAMRKEIRVRPQDPVRAAAETQCEHLAALLIGAYTEMGGDELARLIARAATGSLSADQRITVVYDALRARPPATTATNDRHRALGESSTKKMAPSLPPPHSRAFASVDTRTSRRTPSTQLPASTSPDPVTQAVAGAPPAPTQSAAMPATAPSPSAPASSHQPTAPAAPPSAPMTRPKPPAPPRPPTASPPAEAKAPGTLSSLLVTLAGGPDDQGFESALQALRATNFRSTRRDRASARRLIRTYGWYAGVLEQQNQVAVDDVLVMIFWHAVIPDLAEPQVANELSRWAGELKAPDTVIRALYAAAIGAADSLELMEQAIGSAVAWRWRNEHQINVPLKPTRTVRATGLGTLEASHDEPNVSAPQKQSSPAVPLPVLLNRKVTLPVSLVLAIFVALIVLLLQVMLH
jgi:hypothetical protein